MLTYVIQSEIRGAEVVGPFGYAVSLIHAGAGDGREQSWSAHQTLE